MELYILSFIIIFLLVFLEKINIIKIIYFRKILIPIICIVFLLCLIIFSNTAVNSAKAGLNLWFNVVFPSLFPFFVVSEMLNKSNSVKAVGVLLEPIMRPLFNVPGCGSFAFVMGITSGYPIGAKITASMHENKLISKIEAERLLAFTNNSGPLFIVGAVAVGMFSSPRLGLFLLGCHIAACITVGMLFKFYRREKKPIKNYDKNLWMRFKKELFSNDNPIDFGSAFGEAIRNSVSTILAIGGFIILFSVIINLLIEIGLISQLSSTIHLFMAPLGISKDIIQSIISGLFEITTGTNLSSKALNTTIELKLVATSFIIGWAGLSVHSQVLSIISKTNISIKPYLLGKLLQGTFSALYTYIVIKIAGLSLLLDKPVFSHTQIPQSVKWYDSFFISCEYIFISFSLILLIALIINLKLLSKKIMGLKN